MYLIFAADSYELPFTVERRGTEIEPPRGTGFLLSAFLLCHGFSSLMSTARCGYEPIASSATGSKYILAFRID